MKRFARQVSDSGNGATATAPTDGTDTATIASTPTSTDVAAILNSAAPVSVSSSDGAGTPTVTAATATGTATGTAPGTLSVVSIATTGIETTPPTSPAIDPTTRSSSGVSVPNVTSVLNTVLSTGSSTDGSQSAQPTTSTTDSQTSASTGTSALISGSASTTRTSSSSSPSITTTTSSTTSTSATPSSTSSSSSSTTHTSSRSSSNTDSSTSSTTSSTTSSASTSLTTVFTEVVTTEGGQATTIFRPIATLNTVPQSSSSMTSQRAAIIGGSIGGVVFILVCLLSALLCWRHRKRAQERAHRYVPTPRSEFLAHEDDFDLAAPNRPRGMGFFGTFKRGDSSGDGGGTSNAAPPGERSRSLAAVGSLDTPEMGELDHEPPPRLLRPVASKTGSYFQEAVWPPPVDGYRISDPLMAASNVDLTSIVDDVMGRNSRGAQAGPSSADAGPSSWSGSPPHPSRLRGGAAESASLLTMSDISNDHGPRTPWHEGSQTMSSAGSSPDLPRHQRDWCMNSESGLLAHLDGQGRYSRRHSSGSGSASWLPAGAAAPALSERVTSPTSPLRVVTEPQRTYEDEEWPAPPSRAHEKARAVVQERRQSSTGSNMDTLDDVAVARRTLQQEQDQQSLRRTSFSVSTSSTQRRRGARNDGESAPPTPYADESELDPRSREPSLPSLSHANSLALRAAQNRLGDVSEAGALPRREGRADGAPGAS